MELKWLNQVENGEEYGRKATILSKLIKSGIPVPEGFTIPNSAFREFLEDNQITTERAQQLITTSRLRADFIDQISRSYNLLTLSREIEGIERIRFLSQRRPSVIIRPSVWSELSYAGQIRSIPNVRGINNVLNGIRSCWASYFSEKVKHYQEFTETGSPNLGLIIQKFINASKSGVGFSLNPVTGEEEIVIECIEGLGFPLSVGESSPSTFYLDKESLEIKKRLVRDQVWMSVMDLDGRIVKRDVKAGIRDEELVKVGKVIKQIESLMGQVYVEWLMKRGNPLIVQVEPLEVRETEKSEFEGIKGYGVSSGVGTGVVRQMGNLTDNNILLLSELSSKLTFALGKIEGVVALKGGLGSAGARICRELGIPCVIYDKHIEEGEYLAIDGSRGILSFEKPELPPEPEYLEVPEVGTGLIITTPGQALSPEEIIEGVTLVNIDLKKLAEHSFREEVNLAHPSLLKQIRSVVEYCKKQGIKTNLLVPEYEPNLFRKLSELGVDYISTKSVKAP